MPSWIRADTPKTPVRAAQVIRLGGLIILPTDTVYGVAADLWQEDAVAALYAAKNRPPDKAIPLLISDFKAISKVAAEVPYMAEVLAKTFWPGPLTIALPKREQVPMIVSSLPTVGVRMPDHSAARAVIRACGGVLAVTSANQSGEPSPLTAKEAALALPTVDLVLDGGTVSGGVASTVVDINEGELRIVREGPISMDAMQRALNR